MPQQTTAWIIQVLWLIFCAYWLLNAFHNKKRAYRQNWFLWRGYILILIIAGDIIAHWLPDRRLIPLTLAVQWAGIAVCAAGIALAIWARTILGRNWSGNPEIKENHELVSRGPYAIVRHPIYTGLLLGILGTIIAIWPGWRGMLFLLITVIFIGIRIWQEEGLMTRQFPESYAAYRKKVHYAILPFLI